MQNLITKLQNNERLNLEDGIKLWNLDIFTLGKFANAKREKLHQNKVFYNLNRHINPSNLCADTCKFCAFSAHRKNENSYTMTKEQILEIAKQASQEGANEVHIVSAHNPFTKPDEIFSTFKAIKENFPNLHIKAMTAAEIDFLSRKFSLSYEEIINKMIESGVDSMPGGGAEIFDEKIRNELCAGKVSSNNWLNIHHLWHKKGRQSNATMLFGHIESKENRIDHMLRLRDLQDKSLKLNNNGKFNAFIPLVYQVENNYLQDIKELGSEEFLKTIAIARLILDNFSHIKAYWATSTLNLAIVAQDFGADDIDGTIGHEKIQSAAGANSKYGKTQKEFIELIQTSNKIPTLRDSLYNEI